MSGSGVPDFIPAPAPEPHPLPDPYEEWAHGAVPSLWEAQRMSADALATMKEAEASLQAAHDNHARTERDYRRMKFAKALEARDIEVGGKRLTDRERGQWVDAETSQMKSRMRHEWGLVETARAAVTRADRAQATLGRLVAWASRAPGN